MLASSSGILLLSPGGGSRELHPAQDNLHLMGSALAIFLSVDLMCKNLVHLHINPDLNVLKKSSHLTTQAAFSRSRSHMCLEPVAAALLRWGTRSAARQTPSPRPPKCAHPLAKGEAVTVAPRVTCHSREASGQVPVLGFRTSCKIPGNRACAYPKARFRASSPGSPPPSPHTHSRTGSQESSVCPLQ